MAKTTADHWIVAVDGKPTDIRGSSDHATRQGKIRKNYAPGSVVTLHYGPCAAETLSRNGRLVVELSAELLPPLATISA